MWNIPLESIETLANLESIPKTEHWYAGVAWVLMEADEDPYTERAIEYFNKALELKPGGWMAMEGLARCYGDNLHQYQTAIDWMKLGIDNLPKTDDLEGIDFYLETRISDWKLQLGQDEEAVESARTAYEASQGFWYGNGTASDVSILRTIKHYVVALYRTKDYTTLTKLLYEIDSRLTWEPNLSLWIVFLREQYDKYYNCGIFDKVGSILQATKDDTLANFMEASIKKAVNLNLDNIADDKPVWLAYQCADWQYHYSRKSEQSIDLYETIVKLIDQSNDVVQHSRSKYRSWSAGQLSYMYFNEAKIAFKSGTDYSIPIFKMEDLAKHKQGSKRYYRASYPALLLGLWLRDYAKADEETWKAAIRPSMKQALYLLSDDDPWNDQQAYAQLGRALLSAGDNFNAAIALGITTRPIDDAKQDATVNANEDVSQDGSSVELVESAVEIQQSIDSSQAETTTDSTAQNKNAGNNDIKDSAIEEDSGEKKEYIAEQEGGTAKEKDNAEDENDWKDEEDDEEDEEDGDEDGDDDEESENLEEDEDVNPKYAGFEPIWICDGPCSTKSSSYSELHFCCICDDTCFCEACINLVKSDQMPFRKCAADHEHLQVYPMTKDAKRITDALMDRKFELQQEWLDGIMKVWKDKD